jgi:hypothetical protein
LIQSDVGDSLAAAKSPVVDFVAVAFLKIQQASSSHGARRDWPPITTVKKAAAVACNPLRTTTGTHRSRLAIALAASAQNIIAAV